MSITSESPRGSRAPGTRPGPEHIYAGNIAWELFRERKSGGRAEDDQEIDRMVEQMRAEQKTTTWAIIGTDNFSYEDYLVKTGSDRSALVAEVNRLNAEQPVRQPGGLHDTFSLAPIEAAARRLGTTPEELLSS